MPNDKIFADKIQKPVDKTQEQNAFMQGNRAGFEGNTFVAESTGTFLNNSNSFLENSNPFLQNPNPFLSNSKEKKDAANKTENPLTIVHSNAENKDAQINRPQVQTVEIKAAQQELQVQNKEEQNNDKALEEIQSGKEVSEKENNKEGETNSTEAAPEKEEMVVVPDVIGPVVTPRMDKAVDKEGEQVEPDAATDNNIVGLVTTAQEFRDQAVEAKEQAKEHDALIGAMSKKVSGMQSSVKKSDKDIQTAQNNVSLKEEKIGLQEKGLTTSKQRQSKVSSEVVGHQKEADKNKGTASDLNREASSLAGTSKKHQDPSEPDSGALSNQLNELSSGAGTISQAVFGAGNSTQKLTQESQGAIVKNKQVEKNIADSKKAVVNTKAKLNKDIAQNATAKSAIAAINPEIAQRKKEKKELLSDADGLLLDSYKIEKGVHKAQENYYVDMSTVEGRKEIRQKEIDKVAQTPPVVSEAEQLLIDFSQLQSEEEQVEFIRNLDDAQREKLKTKFDEFMANYDAEQAEHETSLDENVENIRQSQIEGHNNKRKDRLEKPMGIVTANINRLGTMKRLWMALSMGMSGIWKSITSVTWTDVKNIGIAIINPVEGLRTIAQSVMGIWGDLSNWGGFEKDPVGMILKKASGIANKLLTITGVITGILGVLTVAATVGAIFTAGALAPLAAWLGTATATMGTITFWVAAVALGLNLLNGIKNIYDIHTAKTADVMFENSAELKEDLAASAGAALGMLGAKATTKGGEAIKNAATKNPKTFGLRQFSQVKNGTIATVANIKNRVSSVFKKSTWTKAYASFGTSYKKATSWVSDKFKKDKKDIKPNKRMSEPYAEQVVDDRMVEQPLVQKDKTPDTDVSATTKKADTNVNTTTKKDGTSTKKESAEVKQTKNKKAKKETKEEVFNNEVNRRLESGEISQEMADQIHAYKKANPTGKFSIDEVVAEYESGRRFNPKTGRFNLDKDGMVINEAGYLDTNYHKTSRADMDKPTQDAIDEQLVKRKEGQDLSKDKSKAEEGTQDHADFKAGQKMMRDASEEIGEKAAIAAMKKNFPNAELVYTGKGKGNFDLVFKDGDNYYIVEAKGGSSTLGTRNVDGSIHQQGTREYRKALTKEMKNSSNEAAKKIGRELDDAFESDIRYFHSQTPISKNGKILETILKEFN